MSYRGYKGWRPNSRRNRRVRRPGQPQSRRSGSDWTLILGLGGFILAVLVLLALYIYSLR